MNMGPLVALPTLTMIYRPAHILVIVGTMLGGCDLEESAEERDADAVEVLDEDTAEVLDEEVVEVLDEEVVEVLDEEAVDPQLAAVIDEDDIDPQLTPGIDEDFSALPHGDAARTYTWHNIQDNVVINNGKVHVRLRSALQAARDNGKVTWVRAYGAIACHQRNSSGGWVLKACSIPANKLSNVRLALNLPGQGTHYPTTSPFSTANTGTDGFFEIYGPWSKARCGLYWGSTEVRTVGIAGAYHTSGHVYGTYYAVTPGIYLVSPC